MANRRMGGMGGGQRGNRSFSQHQPFQGSNVSPWQGNMPSNNSVNPGLLSQLASNPQQLALALTSLLQPQQQQMNNPPSLLSLNTSPAFSNQDRDFNRFGRGRDFRRHEPYSKNRNGGWRTMDSKNRNNNKGKDKKRSPSRDQKNKKGDVKKNEKPVKDKEEKKKGDVIDLSVDEGNDEGNEETKRDWKDEKNNSEEKKSESGDEDEKKKDTRNKEGPYSGVPVKFLNCFVCNKEMWDGESMQKHIRGRAHKQMLNSLEESIHITVNILRENMRLAEEKKVIEWNRMQRLQKYHKYNDVESHCNMCDLKFMGKIIVHRKTEGHQRLKRYLHPNCEMCDKEFPARMEWVEHRLTPEHLRKLHETLKDKTGDEDGDLIIKEEELDLEPLLDEPLQMEVENPVLELTDDMAGLQNLIPAYKPDRAVSTQSLKPFEGFMCKLCNRSFESDDLAQAHLKTKRHYYQFIEAAKLKYQQHSKKEEKKEENETNNEQKEDAQEGNNESQTEGEADADMYDPEEACKEEETSMEVTNDEGDPSVISLDLKTSLKEDSGDEEANLKEEKEAEVKEEPKIASTPVRQTRMGGGVKNGAGPKSKKARKQ
uniref:Zinc finger protein n=1 Tax=Anoplophora glabripennis TaxID=217634 RepID=V5G0I4_ANOGL